MLPEDLNSLKYVELQRLAKSAGIRANQKVDKLIRALTDYYENSSESHTPSKSDAEKNAKSEELKSSSALEILSVTTGSTPVEKRKTDSGSVKKRKRTFELDEPTLKGDSTPVIQDDQPRTTRQQTSRNATPQDEIIQPVKRLRRSTFDKNSPSIQERSPGTVAILDSIDGGCSSAERKKKLLSAIEKKVQLKMINSPSTRLKSQPSQIPRFMAFLTNKKKDNQNSSTPGKKKWDTIHKKEFSKFDSIDVYLEKKQQRKENLSASMKKKQIKKSPAKASLKISRVTPKKPNPSNVFKPTVVSTKNICFDFSKSVADSCKIVKNKKVNTPSRQPATTPKSKTVITAPKNQLTSSSKVKDFGLTNGATPFKFTGNTTVSMNTTLSSAKKNVFDLKASLAKPLTWKPHTGKLQPVDTNTVQNVPTRKHSTKGTAITKARLATRRDTVSRMKKKDSRRAAQFDRRSNQKYVDMMRRRGLMA